MTTPDRDDAYIESLLRPVDGAPASGTALRREAEAASAQIAARSASYASGRSVRLVEAAGEDALVVESPGGVVELHVRFTSNGPVLRFEAAALELRSAGDVSVDCARLRVRAAAGIALETAKEARIAAEQEVWIDGRDVLLNCDGELPPDLRDARAREKAEE